MKEMNLSGNSDLSLTMLATCAQGSCPTVYATNRGTLFVQGYTVSVAAAAEAGVTLPDGEQMVEIPVDLVTRALGGAPLPETGPLG